MEKIIYIINNNYTTVYISNKYINNICMERERDAYCKGLTLMTMETDGSHDLQPASWRPRGASGVVPS